MTSACSASAGITGSQVALLLVSPWTRRSTGAPGSPAAAVGDAVAVQDHVAVLDEVVPGGRHPLSMSGVLPVRPSAP